MNKYYYDFHIHSCLSPCADDDMTPNNIAGMASLSGLNIVALTDHNSCRNCPAFFMAARKYGIIPIPGMELTTSEEIHVVCLFETLEDALAFNDEVDGERVCFPNRADLFGNQFVMDENDNVVSEEENLLINATQISIDSVPALVKRYNGVCFPAHIDRESNGIIAILGDLPADLPFDFVELNDCDKKEALANRFFVLNEKEFLVGSDAHHLWDISDKRFFFEIDDEPYSSALVRKKLLDYLRGAKA